MTGTVDIAEFFVHEVTARPFQGAGARGNVYGAAVTMAGFLEYKRRLVHTPDGSQVMSQSAFYTAPGNGVSLTPQSQVTQPGDITPTIVLNTELNTSGDLDLPDHFVAYLQ